MSTALRNSSRLLSIPEAGRRRFLFLNPVELPRRELFWKLDIFSGDLNYLNISYSQIWPYNNRLPFIVSPTPNNITIAIIPTQLISLIDSLMIYLFQIIDVAIQRFPADHRPFLQAGHRLLARRGVLHANAQWHSKDLQQPARKSQAVLSSKI